MIDTLGGGDFADDEPTTASHLVPGEPVEVDLSLLDIKPGQISDGFHTFDELYAHRTALFALFCRLRPDLSWRSREHHENPDGTVAPMFDGMFIAGASLPIGRSVQQITYHCENATWDWFDGVPVLDHAPVWDGHSSADVVERLNAFWRLNS